MIDIRELMIYTGEKEEITAGRLARCREAIASEWQEKNPVTPAEIQEFYIQNQWYIYDLYSWPHEPQMWDLLDRIARPGMKVLDYGCGIGDVAIYLAEKGCAVTAVDLLTRGDKPVPCRTFHFCQWRVYARKMSGSGNGQVKFSFDPEIEKFDLVTCIDVLEHLTFPLRYVVQLGDLLNNQESLFFITPRFGSDDTGLYPMHLESNRWLGKKFVKVMTALAFRPKTVVEKYFPVWQPVYKPPSSPDGGKGSETGSSSSSS